MYLKFWDDNPGMIEREEKIFDWDNFSHEIEKKEENLEIFFKIKNLVDEIKEVIEVGTSFKEMKKEDIWSTSLVQDGEKALP